MCVIIFKSFPCVLLSASACLQLIKGRESIDYSHVGKRRLFCSPLIKDSAWRKSGFIVILMLVCACSKTQSLEEEELVSQLETSSSSLLLTDAPHEQNTHTAPTFSPIFYAAPSQPQLDAGLIQLGENNKRYYPWRRCSGFILNLFSVPP